MLEVYTHNRYPREVELRSGEKLTLRPVQVGDRESLLEFFGEIPREDLIYLDQNPRDPAVIEEWLSQPDLERLVHLLALRDGRIVADCLIHQDRRGWKSHHARVRVVVHPQHRRKRLASLLIQETFQYCLNAGLDLVVAEFMENQKAAMEVFSQNGFLKLATVPHFVRDLEGRDHDLVVMARNIRDQEYFAAD